jgi:hypothetical protein
MALLGGLHNAPTKFPSRAVIKMEDYGLIESNLRVQRIIKAVAPAANCKALAHSLLRLLTCHNNTVNDCTHYLVCPVILGC